MDARKEENNVKTRCLCLSRGHLWLRESLGGGAHRETKIHQKKKQNTTTKEIEQEKIKKTLGKTETGVKYYDLRSAN